MTVIATLIEMEIETGEDVFLKDDLGPTIAEYI